MDRRGFLRFLGMGVAAAVAPTKAYSFLGGILRPRLELTEIPGQITYITATDIMKRREEAYARMAKDLEAVRQKIMGEWIEYCQFMIPYCERRFT